MAETIYTSQADVESLYVNDRGDYEETSTGIRLDNTVRTKCLLALRARRDQYWYDLDYGSRIHTIKTLRDAYRHAEHYCQEALQFLIDRGEIVAVTVPFETISQDGATGAVQFQVVIEVTEEEIVDILILPVKL
jgi:phage gp46-like protein